MKKVIVTLVILIIGSALFAADTATLTLYGTVPEILNINVTQTAGDSGSPLDLTVAAAVGSPTTVATVTEESNSGVGYSVAVSGSFDFEHDTTADVHPFIVYYDGVAVTTSGQVVVNSGLKSDGSAVKDIEVSYDAVPADQSSGTYLSDITLVISAN